MQHSDAFLINLLAFGRALKEAGIQISTGRMIDAARALEFVNIGSRQDFHIALRSNLVSRKEDIPLFDRVFDSFWKLRALTERPYSRAPEAAGAVYDRPGFFVQSPSDDTPRPDSLGSFAYSPVEVLNKKDFSQMKFEDSAAIRRAILLLARKIATRVGRRRKLDGRTEEIDLRRTMRRSLKYGGDILEFQSRKRKLKKTRIILLCDVSGSMECYSRFLIQFMFGLQNELWGVDTFVFSTSLTRITSLIRSKAITAALEKVSQQALGWSGGTNIGRSLQIFNRDFAPALVDHRTIVILISDGWECGDLNLLQQEMQRLKRRVSKMLWLNPLLGDKNYEPLCKGMQTVLPYLDYFLPAHNIESLLNMARTLEQVAT
jgi:uncharacterized protein with von Willebrand factor type A (vWA) domain